MIKILNHFKIKGFTLPEGIIALAIFTLSVGILSALAINYISILISIKERFLALNFAQEGLELALALRDKQIESGISNNWLGITTAGSYCIYFNTQNQKIITQQSLNPCEIFPGYKRLVTYYDAINGSNNNLINSNIVKITSEVFWGKNDKIKLETIITKWHPVQ